jgi:chromosome segregation ATPase
MSVEFSNAYQEILLDNFNSVIKQNMMFQTQLKMAEEAQKNNKHDEKINLLNGEFNSLQQKYDEALTKIANLEPRANVGQSLHDEKTRIQAALNEETRKNAAHVEEIRQKSTIIEEHTRKISEITDELSNLKNELDKKNKEIEDLNTILEKKEPTMPKVKKTNSKNDMNGIVADGGSF